MIMEKMILELNKVLCYLLWRARMLSIHYLHHIHQAPPSRVGKRAHQGWKKIETSVVKEVVNVHKESDKMFLELEEKRMKHEAKKWKKKHDYQLRMMSMLFGLVKVFIFHLKDMAHHISHFLIIDLTPFLFKWILCSATRITMCTLKFIIQWK